MKPSLIGGALGSLLLFGCIGDLTSPSGPAQSGDPSSIGSAHGDGDGEAPMQFTCNDEQSAVTPAVPLRRLTRAHYESSVRDLFASSLPSAQFNAVWAEFSPSLQSLPNDAVSKKAPFAGMDSTVSQEHVITYFRMADTMATAITNSSERVQALLACDAGAAESACIDAFIARFGRRAFRHTLSAEESSFLREVYAADGIDATALHDLIAVVLNAPQFLYHVEFGGEAVAGKPDTYKLSDAELAAKLAYHFWQTPPDDELLAAADRGELSTDEGFAKAVDRLVNDERMRKGLDTFVREWFDMRSLRALDQSLGNKVFDAFVGDDVPSPELNHDMVTELLDSFAYHAEKGDGFAEWVQSPYAFARTEELARLQGVEPWSGTGEPPKYNDAEHAGLLTRPALLASAGANTRPIMRGVFIRERLLCDEIAPPPVNANAKPPELSGEHTTREVVEALTEKEGTPCAGCHKTQINGLGFALEGFDALGRVRETQDLYDPNGKVVATKPVNVTSTPRVSSGDMEPVEGANELTDRILDSGKAEACFSRQYLRFALNREADLTKDGCALESLRVKLKEGASVAEAMKALVFRPEFRERSIGEVK